MSQESKSISQAVRLVKREGLGQFQLDADKFVRIDFRGEIPVLRNKNAGKFVLGAVRMWLDGQLRDATTISRLNTTLKFVADPTHIDEYDRNLNGLSAQELIDRFAPVRLADQDKDREELNRQQYTENAAYKIIPINSFEEATKYGKYNDWCLTQPRGKNMYDSYTADGVNQLYIILRDGFENVPKQAGENTPYDDYGVSMMTVIVDPDGDMAQSTTRWNHENGSSDHAMTPKQISQITGRNFYQTFKPNTKFKDILTDAIKKLDMGATPEQAFGEAELLTDRSCVVCVGQKYNILDSHKQLLLSKWFDVCGRFQEDFARIKSGDKWNFIGKDSQFLSGQWFDYCENFCEDFARIKLDDKWNFIGKDGKYLFSQWFDNCGNFFRGFVRVQLDGKWNFIDKDGKFLSKQWFDDCDSYFVALFARIKLGNKWNFIDKDGKFLFRQWFENCKSFDEGFSGVQLNEKWNFIDKDGKFLSEQWFDDCKKFEEGFAHVQLDGKWNFIDKDGNLLSERWFDACDYFFEGFARVQLCEKWNFIDKDGNLLSKQWFDECRYFFDGIAGVQLCKKWNFIDKDGKLLSDTWFDDCTHFAAGFAYVKLNDKWHSIDMQGVIK